MSGHQGLESQNAVLNANNISGKNQKGKNKMIYFIQQTDKGPIKIGYTNNLKNRLSALQTSNPTKLIVLGTVYGERYTEKRIHQHLRFYHIGGEWFRPSSFVIEYISSYPGYNPEELIVPKNIKTLSKTIPSTLQVAEKNTIIQTLIDYKNNKFKTALKLNISRSTLYAKIKKYNLQEQFV